jgi:hypothetical protein
MGLFKLGKFIENLLDRQIDDIVYYVKEGWEDELGPIIVKGTGANDPTWKAFNGNHFGYAFEPTSKMNQCWVDFHLHHNMNPQKPVFIHVHWLPADATAGIVRWGIELILANMMSGFTMTRTFYLEQAAAEVYPYHQIIECPESEAIPGDTVQAGTLIKARLFRDATHANDTYTGDAFASFLNLHYRVDRNGTPHKLDGDLLYEEP